LLIELRLESILPPILITLKWYSIPFGLKNLEDSNFKVTFEMKKVREVIAYQDHFLNFLNEQPEKVQNKIFKIMEAIEIIPMIPSKYLRLITGSKGLYEARVRLGSNIWRIFCFFDDGNLVILLNGFVKKTQKTPRSEIEKALKLKERYYHEKEK